MPISTIFTALFYPYIARERTAQNLISSVRSERSAFCLKERHRSQNQCSLKREERKSDFKERCAQFCKIHTSILPAVPKSNATFQMTKFLIKDFVTLLNLLRYFLPLVTSNAVNLFGSNNPKGAIFYLVIYIYTALIYSSSCNNTVYG